MGCIACYAPRIKVHPFTLRFVKLTPGFCYMAIRALTQRIGDIQHDASFTPYPNWMQESGRITRFIRLQSLSCIHSVTQITSKIKPLSPVAVQYKGYLGTTAQPVGHHHHHLVFFDAHRFERFLSPVYRSA